ncbi:hypothetical protein AOQ84DRAFT_391824 [Glonium stellatum]|uniref:Zn(2)-C6 fungal-type domain-containing protein n=1 Tax=Glonium stellatum TaxID=574774 RepID=A0A8E2JP84_9PEZI|nr:hypothetical protein AOQ84DRAFT_391824 [Glonium stellatum]
MSPLTNSNGGHTPKKRQRLFRSCNLCRARKVRCDEQQPSCQNCLKARAPCIITDPRRPGVDSSATRRRAGNSQPSTLSCVADSASQNTLLKLGNEPFARSIGHEPRNSGSLLSLSASIYSNDVGETQIDDSTTAVHESEVNLGNKLQILDAPSLDSTTVSSSAFNEDVSTARRKYVGPSSLQVFTRWLDLTFTTLGVDLASKFKSGMRFCEEFALPLSPQVPGLPVDWEGNVTTFFREVHPLFRLLDQKQFCRWAGTVSHLEDLSTIEISERPLLACLYAVISIGADQHAGSTSTESKGLHQERSKQTNDYDEARNIDLYSRVWGVTYCLEKLMSFESGRPSMISDGDISRCIPLTPADTPNIFGALLGLAKIQGQINQCLFNTSPSSIASLPEEILRITGEFDSSLTQWVNSLPDEIRPGNDFLCCRPSLLPFVGFLSFQFHQTVATLHRRAVLVGDRLYRRHVDKYCSRLPWRHRLLSSESICLSSARAIAKLLQESIQGHFSSRLNGPIAPSLAAFILTVQILKHPWSWSTHMDFLLLEGTSRWLEETYSTAGQDQEFYSMLVILREIASQYISRASSMNFEASNHFLKGQTEPADLELWSGQDPVLTPSSHQLSSGVDDE